jgi:hypothetical protein
MCSRTPTAPRRPPNQSFNRAAARSRARQRSNRRSWNAVVVAWQHVARLATHPAWAWRLDEHTPGCRYAAAIRRLTP